VSREKPKTTPRTEEDFAFAPEGTRAGKGAAAKPAGAKGSDEKGSGRVKFDDRGNAIWEWSVSTGAYGRDVGTDRLHKLENASLSLADDAPTPGQVARPNPLGAKKGYDPYDSGRLGKSAAADRKKKDLRRLGEWLKLKKQSAQG
jgi:hypothetical protein